MRRRELVWMGSIAALVGLALAALLTASFGSSSSGPPASLRPPPSAAAAVAAKSPAARRAQGRTRPAGKHRRLRRHRRHATAARTLHSTPKIAHARPPAAPRAQPVADPQPTQTVALPAPAPKPVRQLSKPAPKRSSPGGVSFDDSG